MTTKPYSVSQSRLVGERCKVKSSSNTGYPAMLEFQSGTVRPSEESTFGGKINSRPDLFTTRVIRGRLTWSPRTHDQDCGCGAVNASHADSG